MLFWRKVILSRKKQKKQNFKLNIKLLIASVIMLIFIICFAYNIIALFVNPTDTFMIENGKISSSEQAVGYIIREEKLFQGENYKNGISQIKTEGQRVAKGEYIADMGATGQATGVHVHFEIIKDGRTVNPMDYLQKR